MTAKLTKRRRGPKKKRKKKRRSAKERKKERKEEREKERKMQIITTNLLRVCAVSIMILFGSRVV